MIRPLDVVRLAGLMDRTSGRPEVAIGLIDGPVALGLPDFSEATIREVPGKLRVSCNRADTMACTHGTFVAGILSARRGSAAPAICPACTLLLRPIFAEASDQHDRMPSADPEELAEAIVDTVDAGARIINLSSALLRSSRKDERVVGDALDYTASRGVLAIAAAGNQGSVGSSPITRHPCVIPVTACNNEGRPLNNSNLGGSIGRRGLSAPGEKVTSLGPDGQAQTFSGTSAAAPFVTGAIALLWSEFPKATATEMRLAITQTNKSRRTIAPPLLDAWAAYEAIALQGVVG